MSQDDREHADSDIFLVAEFRPVNSSGKYCLGLTSDISGKGFRLEAQSHAELNQGDILEIILKHPQSDSAVPILGKVIWIKSSWYKYIVGVTFHNFNREKHQGIQALLSTVLEKSLSIPEVVTDNGTSSHELEGVENCDHTEGVQSEESDDCSGSVEDTMLQSVPLQKTIDNKSIPESRLGNKGRMLIIVTTVAVIVFLIALPTIYDNFNDISEIPIPETLPSSSQKVSVQKPTEERADNFLVTTSTPKKTSHRVTTADETSDGSHVPETDKADHSKGTIKIESDDVSSNSYAVKIISQDDPHSLTAAIRTDDSSTTKITGKAVESEEPSTAPHSEETEFTGRKGREYAVIARVLNIRAAPSIQSPIVGKTRKGEVFTSAESEHNDEGLWLKTDKGYVFGNYAIALDYKNQRN